MTTGKSGSTLVWIVIEGNTAWFFGKRDLSIKWLQVSLVDQSLSIA